MPHDAKVYFAPEEWTPNQQDQIILAIDSWKPYFDLQLVAVPRQELAVIRPHPAIRLLNRHPNQCTPHPEHNAAGVTTRTADGTMTSCVDPDLADSVQTLVAHELGHAMRLDHTSGPAIMTPEPSSYTPTQADLEEYHRHEYL